MSSHINTIPTMLEWLLEQKTNRDGMEFTSSQLANALNVPRSVIQRLMHPDPEKRVINPRIDTLMKIVNFFRTDGFDITVNDFLAPRPVACKIPVELTMVLLPLYSFSDLKNTIGNFPTMLRSNSQQAIALQTAKALPPIFKKGSIFVVDKQLSPSENTLIVVWKAQTNSVQLLRYENKQKLVLQEGDYKIGVVIQVNAHI